MRHGDYSKEKLTRLGKKQVKFSSEYLKKCNIDKIYSSPTTRCIQSSEIVSKVLNKQLINNTSSLLNILLLHQSNNHQ